MSGMRGSVILERSQKFFWALFLLTLTVTSFPLFPGGVGGKTLVRPLSVYPLLVLLVLVTFQRLLRKPLPKTFLPLFVFIVAALISSTLALLLGSEVFKGVTMTARLLRNIVSLGLGVAIYLTVTLYPQNWEDLARSLRWLYAGFAIALFWGSLQAVYILHFSQRYFNLLNQIQAYISTRKLFTTRISGLTYEPKWFAEQISFLLLPWLLGSVLRRQSVFKWRYRWITVEMLLLVWAVSVMVFTFSRTGIFILVVMVILSFFFARPRSHATKAVRPREKRTPSKWARLVEIGLLVTVIGGVLIFAGTQNRYFSRFWRYWTEDGPTNKSYLEYIAVSQRLVYWLTAFRMYEAYPVFGVGLGNYAFYFDQMLPNQPWNKQPEIVRQITPVEGGDRLITPKNFYARLLAETGSVGTIVFTTFVIAVFGCALFLYSSPSPEQKFWGLSGILSLVIFTIVIFSFDSFAFPNLWVVFGFITAAAHLPAPTSPADQ